MERTERLINGRHGNYVPYEFAWNMADVWEGIDPEDLAILKTGPGNPQYQDAWDNVLSSAKFEDSEGNIWYLYQEGDLFGYTGDGEQFV